MHKCISEVIVFIFFLLMPAFLNAQIDSLRGNVKEVEQSEKITGPFSMTIRELPNRGQYEMNENDILYIELPRLNQPGIRNFYNGVRKFNDKGKLIFESFTRAGYYKIYSYDTSGNKILERMVFNDSIESIRRFTFGYWTDSIPNILLSEISYWSLPQNGYEFIYYLYDASGRIKERRQIHEDGNAGIQTFSHNNRGLITKEGYVILGNKIEKSDGILFGGDTIRIGIYQIYAYNDRGLVKSIL